MRKILVLAALLIGTASLVSANENQEKNNALEFWQNLQQHCGKAYEGRLADGVSAAGFDGHRLVMHVRSCDENTIRIPFFVGEDRSRTWVLTYNDGIITLKHDHRLEDGSEDEVTQYGGTSSNGGFTNLQFFPADVETAERIGYASSNIWWITLDEASFSYNLRRLGSNTMFSVLFDLSNTVEAPEAPWGWED